MPFPTINYGWVNLAVSAASLTRPVIGIKTATTPLVGLLHLPSSTLLGELRVKTRVPGGDVAVLDGSENGLGPGNILLLTKPEGPGWVNQFCPWPIPHL